MKSKRHPQNQICTNKQIAVSNFDTSIGYLFILLIVTD